eukprot:gene16960-19387_t
MQTVGSADGRRRSDEAATSHRTGRDWATLGTLGGPSPAAAADHSTLHYTTIHYTISAAADYTRNTPAMLRNANIHGYLIIARYKQWRTPQRSPQRLHRPQENNSSINPQSQPHQTKHKAATEAR